MTDCKLGATRMKRLERRGLRAGARTALPGPLVPNGRCHAVKVEGDAMCGFEGELIVLDCPTWDAASMVAKCRDCEAAIRDGRANV